MTNTQKKIEGYWYSLMTPQYPKPSHSDTPFSNKELILSKLTEIESNARKVRYKGISQCRCCELTNGSGEYSYKDWVWPEGFKHYIEVHNVMPSGKFLTEVLELKEIMTMDWTKNVIDEFKSLSNEQIKTILDSKRHKMAAAFENWMGDFNMSSGFRNANGFNLKELFYIGKRQWDRRGSVGSHNYIDITHCESFHSFKEVTKKYTLIGIDNIPGAISIEDFVWPENPLVIFGEEGLGLTSEARESCSQLVYIPMFGSVRSFNCAVASGIVMYDYAMKYKKEQEFWKRSEGEFS